MLYVEVELFDPEFKVKLVSYIFAVCFSSSIYFLNASVDKLDSARLGVIPWKCDRRERYKGGEEIFKEVVTFADTCSNRIRRKLKREPTWG